MNLICRIFLLASLLSAARASQCGYPGSAGNQIRSALDTCFSDNVIQSRAKMAIGFEFCFGVNFQILNDTVAIPYNKKIKETTQQLINLSQSMCSDNEDALDQFVFTHSLGKDQGGDNAPDPKDTSPRSLRKCVQFFSKVQNLINTENFEISYILTQNEALIAPMYPSKPDREKIFTIVLNVVQPLASCLRPMEALKAELIRKYLRQYLAALVHPTKASFTEDTYDILMNPEFYSIQGIDTSGIFKGKRGLFEVEIDPNLIQQVEKGRTIKLQMKPPNRVSDQEKGKILEMDRSAQVTSPAARDREVVKAVATGQVTRTQVFGMTPRQKLDARLISPAAYRRQVLIDEHHNHPGMKADLDDMSSPRAPFRRHGDAREDQARKVVKGYNIDKKIQDIFSI